MPVFTFAFPAPSRNNKLQPLSVQPSSRRNSNYAQRRTQNGGYCVLIQRIREASKYMLREHGSTTTTTTACLLTFSRVTRAHTHNIHNLAAVSCYCCSWEVLYCVPHHQRTRESLVSRSFVDAERTMFWSQAHARTPPLKPSTGSQAMPQRKQKSRQARAGTSNQRYLHNHNG